MIKTFNAIAVFMVLLFCCVLQGYPEDTKALKPIYLGYGDDTKSIQPKDGSEAIRTIGHSAFEILPDGINGRILFRNQTLLTQTLVMQVSWTDTVVLYYYLELEPKKMVSIQILNFLIRKF